MTFLEYYRENLAHIRGIAAEFAAEFPKVAARLELSDYNCQDPYVERLLEGTAFLAARVEHKLERGFPRFLETVATSAAPIMVSPIPSYGVIRCTADFADERLRTAYTMKRGTQFRCRVPGVDTPCVYSTIADVSVSAAILADVRYLTRDLSACGFGDADGAAALALTVQDGDGVGGAAMPDDLLAYIDLPDSAASELQGQLCGDLRGVYARTGGVTRRLEGVTVEIPVFSGVFDGALRVVSGVQALVGFMACPRLFKFFRICGLKRLFDETPDRPVELFFVFGSRIESFVRTVGPNAIRFGCVPVANVFPRRSDRTECNGAFEHHVQPDRSAPQNFEVFAVQRIEAFDAHNRSLFTALPGFDGSGPDRFVLHRRARLFDVGRVRSSYHGTEAYVSISGANYDRCHDDIRQISAELLCTNRDLPLLLRKEDPVDTPAAEPLAGAVFVDQPSMPFPPLAGGGAVEDWDKVGLVAANLSSVLWRNGMVPTDIVRRMVRTCLFDNGGVSVRLADAIAEIRSKPRTFRFVSDGSPYFESGWRVDLTLKEDACSGTGVFIYARVLKELFFSYVPINTCIEFVVGTDRRKELFRWQE